MKTIFVIFFLIFFSLNSASANRDITNLKMKPSVHKGKKGKPYEVVKSKNGEPTIGKKAYKFTLLPYDCGRDSKWSDCKARPIRARSEIGAWKNTFSSIKSERWISFSIFLPEDYQSVFPTRASFFQIYKKGLGPILMLRDLGNDLLIAGIMETNSAEIISGKANLVNISEMLGEWTHFKIHLKYTDETDGFWKFYVNDKLKYHVEGATRGIVKSKNGLYVKAGIYQTGTDVYKKFHQKDIPTQTIYMDNIFVSKTEKRLIKLIDKAK
jgi:hypothetical protein